MKYFHKMYIYKKCIIEKYNINTRTRFVSAVLLINNEFIFVVVDVTCSFNLVVWEQLTTNSSLILSTLPLPCWMLISTLRVEISIQQGKEMKLFDCSLVLRSRIKHMKNWLFPVIFVRTNLMWLFVWACIFSHYRHTSRIRIKLTSFMHSTHDCTAFSWGGTV